MLHLQQTQDKERGFKVVYLLFWLFFSFFLVYSLHVREVPGGSALKNLYANAGDSGLIPGSGRSLADGSNPLQYSCLENSMDRGAWRAAVHGVAKVGHNLAAKQQLNTVLSKIDASHFKQIRIF